MLAKRIASPRRFHLVTRQNAEGQVELPVKLVLLLLYQHAGHDRLACAARVVDQKKTQGLAR